MYKKDQETAGYCITKIRADAIVEYIDKCIDSENPTLTQLNVIRTVVEMSLVPIEKYTQLVAQKVAGTMDEIYTDILVETIDEIKNISKKA
jgi:hypothetical protein